MYQWPVHRSVSIASSVISFFSCHTGLVNRVSDYYLVSPHTSLPPWSERKALTTRGCSLCCGDPPGACNSQACNGLNGTCTGTYVGCPCSGVDFNAPSNVTLSDGNGNKLSASGFQANQSSTWTSVGDYQLTTESYLGFMSNGQYGLDTVGLGVEATTGLTSNQNVVAGILAEPCYLSQVELKGSNATGVNGTASFMAQLKKENLIPSLSYGYTAGAIDRTSRPLCIKFVKLTLSYRPATNTGKPHA